MASSEQKKRLLKAKIAMALHDELGRVPKEEEINQVFFLTRVMYKDSGKDSGQKLTDVSYRSAAGPCNPSQATATIQARSTPRTSHRHHEHRGVY